MLLQHANMWEAWGIADLWLFTANAYVTKAGALTMGRGIAKEVRDRWPGIDHRLGQAIAATKSPTDEYGLLVSPNWPKSRLGAFQVKYHWRQRADLDLIAHSTRMLIDWCAAHPRATVALNFPGIGNGRLAPEDVFEIIQALPDSVTVHHLEPISIPEMF